MSRKVSTSRQCRYQHRYDTRNSVIATDAITTVSIRVYGNRPLKTLPGRDTRPTCSRVREAVFNIWQDRLLDCCWLDLCTGVGSMGAEALGRGVKTAIGIEQSKRACQIIRHNWGRIASEHQRFRVIRGDVRRTLGAVAKEAPFDCIYFDPPYASGLYLPVLQAIDRFNLLAPDGELAVEYATSNTHPPETCGQLVCRDRRSYGNTSLSFYNLAH